MYSVGVPIKFPRKRRNFVECTINKKSHDFLVRFVNNRHSWFWKLHSTKGSCNFENFQNHSYLLITNCTRGRAISHTKIGFSSCVIPKATSFVIYDPRGFPLIILHCSEGNSNTVKKKASVHNVWIVGNSIALVFCLEIQSILTPGDSNYSMSQFHWLVWIARRKANQ